MSTSKNIGLICGIAALAALVLTVVLMAVARTVPVDQGRVMGYEDKLFDTSYVHTLDIQIDDWDAFLATCESEEYSPCNAVIDGETFNLVGIRGKGNTSLSAVSRLDSSRYSFKLEFDQYESSGSYHGLDKLSLNNLIQDATYMKDYLSYTAMAEFGVDAPLCSYVYITVNGEDWGLYLAVEGVEDSFLERNHGADYGELYKPDSMEIGGGRGNGADFDMAKFNDQSGEGERAAGAQDAEGGRIAGAQDAEGERIAPPGVFGAGEDGRMEAPDAAPDASSSGILGSFSTPSAPAPGAAPGTVPAPDAAPDAGDMGAPDAAPNTPDAAPAFDAPAPGSNTPDTPSTDPDERGGPGAGGMGAADVKLQYIDDNASSYSNIFDNAKTSATDADKARLIASLKSLSAQENIESIVDVDEVMRYFVVHNYVCNGDSYTGSMIHNYYLYEEDGQLSMIPWDYNLAFGTFEGSGTSSATTAVNEPIDSPVSGGDVTDRPMFAWIVESEQYLAQYHALFAEFLSMVDMAAMAQETAQMIAPYVAKDPTAFYSYDEFERGVDTLVVFCQLRTESVEGQLTGAIPSTTAGQQADPSALIDVGSLDLNDMGSMADTNNGSMGGTNGGAMGGGNGGAMGGGMERGAASGGAPTAPDAPVTPGAPTAPGGTLPDTLASGVAPAAPGGTLPDAPA